MSVDILAAVTGVSSIFGLMGLMSYLYFHLQISRAERSLREVVEGEGLFNAHQVLQILNQFSDDMARLEALKALTRHDGEKAENLLSKVNEDVNIERITNTSSRNYRNTSIVTALVFLTFAAIGMTYEKLSVEDAGLDTSASNTDNSSTGTSAEIPIENTERIPTEQPDASQLNGNVKISLRKTPKNMSVEQVEGMLIKWGFYEKDMNANGSFANTFIDHRDGTITDERTGLMWQRVGSENSLSIAESDAYINDLNRESYAGQTGWRIPTLEEAASLIESEKIGNGFFIDSVFGVKYKKPWVWTSDSKNETYRWYVLFNSGTIDKYNVTYRRYVRAVRAVER